MNENLHMEHTNFTERGWGKEREIDRERETERETERERKRESMY